MLLAKSQPSLQEPCSVSAHSTTSSKFSSFGPGSIFRFSLVQSVCNPSFMSSFFSNLTPVMTAGYGFRYLAAKDTASLMKYIGQSLCLLLPPSLYAATIYMIYGRIVLFVNNPSASVIRPTRVTKIFVGGDVLAFLMQSSGGGMMAQAGNETMGKNIMLGGLFVQLLFFGFFLVISIIFWFRMRSSAARHTVPMYGNHSWHGLLMLTIGGAIIIILRCFYRIIESAQGHSGYLISHEVYLYLFDAAPMLIVQAAFNVIHAGDVFPRGFRMEKLEATISSEEIGLNHR